MRPVWAKLDVPKARREKLAELTGIPAPNLSGLNTGRLPMTREMAQRIVDAVPGLSVLELGAPAEEADDAGETLLTRLEELEAALAESVRKQSTMGRELGRLQERVRQLEARPGPDEAQSVTP